MNTPALTKTDRFLIPAGLFLSALLLRLLWTWNTHSPTLDTAVVGLMALDIQEGARPLFFTGQGYMGALEAYLTAGVFEIFGSDRFTMCFAPSVLGAFWPVLMFWILRTAVGPRAAVAGAVMVVFPAEVTLRYSAVPYGGYPGTYVFGSALMLHALIRTLQDRVRPWPDAVGFSTLLLLGVWTNLQIVPYLAAASVCWLRLLWFRRRDPRVWLPFALAPLAFALALIPQILLSAQNPSSPPLFSSFSGKNVVRSVRALVTFDVPHLVTWKDSPIWLHRLTLGGLGILTLTGMTVMAVRRKHLGPLLAVSGILLLAFSVLYFPHSMSGFVPRYVIVPYAWVIAVAAAVAVSSGHRRVRSFAITVWTGWLILQLLQYSHSMKVQREKLDDKMAEIHAVIDAAREQGLEALRFIGSGMEGHRAAAFAFEAKKHPVFVSSYDERRRDADLKWHTSDAAGYFFTEAFEPYVRGSLDALNVEAPEIRSAGRFRVMRMPRVPPSAETALLPDQRQLTSVPPGAEKIGQDAFWTVPKEGAELTVTFSEPFPVAGLRLAAPPEHSLPYQVTVTAIQPDGSEQVLQQSHQRLGTSYLEGGRVYFKGYFDLQDSRWEPQTASAIRISMIPGRLNKEPVGLEAIEVLVASEEASDAIDWAALKRALQSYPEARVIMSDALSARLRREGSVDLGDQLHRLPLPWNPRDPTSQPPRFEVDLAQGLLFISDPTYMNTLHYQMSEFSTVAEKVDYGAISLIYVGSRDNPLSAEWLLYRLNVSSN